VPEGALLAVAGALLCAAWRCNTNRPQFNKEQKR